MKDQEQLEQILFKEQMKRLDKIKEKLDGESQVMLDDIIDEISDIEMSWGLVLGVMLFNSNGEKSFSEIKGIIDNIETPINVYKMLYEEMCENNMCGIYKKYRSILKIKLQEID